MTADVTTTTASRENRLDPNVIEKAKKEIEARWLLDRIPDGWPPFNIEVSDGCTGVRQIAQFCCIVHDADYHYGRTWYDKLIADWRLASCIWRHGHARMTADYDPDPWSTAPAWFFLAFSRGMGVALFAWPAFRKPHKRKRPQNA